MCFQVKSVELLDADRRQLVDFLVADAPPHRLELAAIQAGEIDTEQGCLDVELDAERAVAKQEEERHLMQQVGAQTEVVNQRQRRGDQRLLEYPRQRQRRSQPSMSLDRRSGRWPLRRRVRRPP